MYNADALRERYARTSDSDLLALMNVGPERLTAESRQALVDEAARRGLQPPVGWTGVVPAINTYSLPGKRRYIKANFGARFVAWIVDSIIGIVPVTVAGVFVGVSGYINRHAESAILLLIACGLWSIWYGFTKDGREGGQSIGKEMMDLMVVNVETNKPCSMGESAMRAIIWFVLNIVPLVGFFIEPVMAIAAEDGRRLGDRAAGTQVIPVNSYVPTSR